MIGLFRSASIALSGRTGDVLRDLGLLVVRVVPALLMLTLHGYGKLTSFGEAADNFPDPLGISPTASMALAVFSEFFCAALLVLGLATRLAALQLVITMAVAAFVVHGADPWAKKELALVYLAAFTVVFLAGPGRISVDGVIARRWTASRDAS